MTIAAIIVAAGRGTRAGGGLPKQWRMLAGRPVVAHAIAAFARKLDRIVLVIHPDDRARAAAIAGGAILVAGGRDTRRLGSRGIGGLGGARDRPGADP